MATTPRGANLCSVLEAIFYPMDRNGPIRKPCSTDSIFFIWDSVLRARLILADLKDLGFAQRPATSDALSRQPGAQCLEPHTPAAGFSCTFVMEQDGGNTRTSSTSRGTSALRRDRLIRCT